MRLTLRTLLAYLDETLDEPARGELERQIAASEHASEWVHRTRDVMRRLKLGAPPLEGSGATDDPNTVAEYLDRTLPEESVAEFERVCLESDQMLAEVASCHHVLAMFLTEPPDVDPDTRTRLHRLKDDMAAALQSQTTPTREHHSAAKPAAAPSPPAAPKAVAEPVPEYLREPSNSTALRWAPAVAALLLLAVTMAFALAPGGWLRGPAEAEVAVLDPTTPPEEATEPEPQAEVTEDETGAEPEDVVEPVAGDAEPVVPSEPTPGATEPEELDTALGEANDTANLETPDEPNDPAPMQDVEPADVEDEGDSGEPVEKLPPPPVRFLGPAGALVVHGVEPDAWRRTAAEQPFEQSVRLVSFPAFRSAFALSDVSTLELVGLTDVSVAPATEDGEAPVIDLSYGRLVLRASADAGADAPERIDVVIDGITYQVELGAEAVLALEADRFYSPGKLSTEVAAPLVAIAHGMAGEIGWESKGVELRISKPKRWFVTGEGLSEASAGFGEPEWVASMPVAPPDQFAAPALAERVPMEGPVWPALVALADPENEPFREVRSLAGRAALALGHPEPLVESFRQAQEKDEWRPNLTTLRAAAARSVDAAASIEQVLINKFGGAAAADLAEMLIGFDTAEVGLDPEAVSRGVVPNVIVPLLESGDVASRVLAGLVLQETIEPLERPFDPIDATRKRARVVQALKRRLQEAEVNPAPR